jgi:hypothetical protein
MGMKLDFQPDQSRAGLYVFNVTSDGTLVAVITINPETAAVHPAYRLPEWATRQMAQAALDMLCDAAGKSAGNPADLRKIEKRPAH